MRFLALLFFLFLLSITKGNSQVVIEGKIHNYDGKSKIYYHPTLEGIYSPTTITTQPNSKGEFKIKYKNEGFGTIRISFKKLIYRFFHDGNSQISFEIDQANIKNPIRVKGFKELMDSLNDSRAVRAYVTKLNIGRAKRMDSIKQASTVSIRGDFQDVNNYYNTNIRSSYISSSNPGMNYYAQFIHKASNPREVLQIIDSLTRIEIDQVELLGGTLVDENIDLKSANEEIKAFLQNEIRAFYASICLSGLSGKQYDQINAYYNNPDTVIDAYNLGWEKLVENLFKEVSANVAPSSNSRDVNELIESLRHHKETYKDYTPQTTTKSNDQFIVEALLKTDSVILDGEFILDAKSIFAAQIRNLFIYLNSQTFYSPTLLHAYNQLKKQYPNSVHITQFEPQVEKLKAYLKSSSESFDKAIFIDKNYYQFQDLLEVVRGKNIMIDIWATWCGPCIEEFKYKSTMQPYIDSGELTMLYISIDKPRWEKKWRDNIKYNQLEGYHVLANDVLIKDMWNDLRGMGGAIPRYALVEKNGRLFINDSARPSQPDRLSAQIEKLLSSTD